MSYFNSDISSLISKFLRTEDLYKFAFTCGNTAINGTKTEAMRRFPLLECIVENIFQELEKAIKIYNRDNAITSKNLISLQRPISLIVQGGYRKMNTLTRIKNIFINIHRNERWIRDRFKRLFLKLSPLKHTILRNKVIMNIFGGKRAYLKLPVIKTSSACADRNSDEPFYNVLFVEDGLNTFRGVKKSGLPFFCVVPIYHNFCGNQISTTCLTNKILKLIYIFSQFAKTIKPAIKIASDEAYLSWVRKFDARRLTFFQSGKDNSWKSFDGDKVRSLYTIFKWISVFSQVVHKTKMANEKEIKSWSEKDPRPPTPLAELDWANRTPDHIRNKCYLLEMNQEDLNVYKKIKPWLLKGKKEMKKEKM